MFEKCLEWINSEGLKRLESNNFPLPTRLDKTIEEDRIVYSVYNIGEQYPCKVLATKREHGVIVELTRSTERLEGKRWFHIYHSRIGTPEEVEISNFKIVDVVFNEPEIYSMFEV